MNPLDYRWQMLRGRWPIRVSNATSTVIPPFSLVLANSTALSSALMNNEVVVPVRQPNAASTDWNWGQYLVTGPMAIGGASGNEGLASELVQPNYLSVSAAPSQGWVVGPKHGQFTAEQYYYGYEILGQPTTYNGVNIALAKWIGPGIVIGKVDDSSVSLGSTCTVSVYVGSTYQTDSTMNITGVVNRGKTLTGLSSPYCGVAQGNGVPVLMWVAC